MELIRHERLDDGHFFIGENGPFQVESGRVFIIGIHDIGDVPCHDERTHDDIFPHAVDRRIGDLGEVFLEIIVQQLGPV